MALQLQVKLLNSITFQEMVKFLAITPSMRDYKLKLVAHYLFLSSIATTTAHFSIFKSPCIVGRTVTKRFEAITCLNRVIFASKIIDCQTRVILSLWHRPRATLDFHLLFRLKITPSASTKLKNIKNFNFGILTFRRLFLNEIIQ